jgi:ABC-2 type transport system ATP-binding protein
VKTLTKVYPGAAKAAVSDLDLTLYPGEIVALLGPNGAGKTTAVKMIAGLVLPTSGSVHVMGHDMVRARTAGVRHIGAVLEGARNLYWRLSAEENLRYFGTLRLTPRRELTRRIDELLSLFGLEAQRGQEVRHFSRGMQQKLAIAAALLHDPDLLLLDEPTLGLDVKAARQLEETIAHLAREQGKAILLTTHMMDVAEKLAQRITVIHQGREVVSEETQSLLRRYSAARCGGDSRRWSSAADAVESGTADDPRRNYLRRERNDAAAAAGARPGATAAAAAATGCRGRDDSGSGSPPGAPGRNLPVFDGTGAGGWVIFFA